MEIKNVKRTEQKSIMISIRIKPSISKWMSENKVSPSRVFDEAIKELMDKDGS